MRTVEEIVSAAALLSREDVRELHRAIERLARQANAIVFTTSRKLTFRLTRQSDVEFGYSRRRSLAIEEDYGFHIQLLSARRPDETLNFAQMYLTLRHLAGESSLYLDDYKMAFAFPFALDVIKGSQTFAYLLEVRSLRDSIYFTLSKMVDPEDKRLKEHRFFPPFEDEFGRGEIRFFESYFYGYLLGRWETLRPEQCRPFVRCVPSDFIIFGYDGEKTFEEQFESNEQYDEAWQRYREQIGNHC